MRHRCAQSKERTGHDHTERARGRSAARGHDAGPERVEAGNQLKILGGLGVRVLCPDFPPRQRAGQDIDLACLGKSRRKVADHLEQAGCKPDKRFNNLNGDRQMYFNAPSGRPIDVMVDRLSMCHVLDFRPLFDSASPTLDPADLLLSKLQIVELNAKDAHDIFHLLSGVRVGPDADPAVHRPRPVRLGAVRRLGLVAHRDRQPEQAARPALRTAGPGPALPEVRPADPGQAAAEVAETVPKGLKWKTRARVGDRVRWYELPEEVDH